GVVEPVVVDIELVAAAPSFRPLPLPFPLPFPFLMPLPGGGAAIASDTTRPATKTATRRILSFMRGLLGGWRHPCIGLDAPLGRNLLPAAKNPPKGLRDARRAARWRPFAKPHVRSA